MATTSIRLSSEKPQTPQPGVGDDYGARGRLRHSRFDPVVPLNTDSDTLAPAGRPTALSVVVPTYNERRNVPEVIRRLDETLSDVVAWEVIFVDDASPDGTADAVREAGASDRRVRLISRHNRRGLSSAVVEGALAATGRIVAVMDGDLQHDESVLPELYRLVDGGTADIASASRFLRPDGADGLASDTRRQISDTGIRFANTVFNLQMTDPLTGFFAVRRELVTKALPNLSETGFKILLDLITSSPQRPKVVEVPFKFRERVHGESKLDNRVMYDFVLFFIEKKIAPILPLPARFISFAVINGVGIFVHMAVLAIAMGLAAATFAAAQLVATFVAMAFNYTVNNMITYRDRQLTGARFFIGFAVFAVLCSVGVFANVSIANVLHREYDSLTVFVPAFAGALITVVWNYLATRAFVWTRKTYPKVARRGFGSTAASR